jgi:hypothetical protein
LAKRYYRPRTVVKAELYDGVPLEDMCYDKACFTEWQLAYMGTIKDYAHVHDGNGLHRVAVGDWMIRHQNGYFKVMTDRDFQRLYKELPE